MSESRINRDNYITISGWMVTELNLKGNELIVYAMIYGFSQAENQTFDGSMNYVAEWLNTSRQTVNNALKSLVNKGLIEKYDIFENNKKQCKYRAVKNMPEKPAAPADAPKENESHNYYYREIIDYLNKKTGKNFSAQNQETRKHIHARIAEGRTLGDFKHVIDIKCAEWLGTDFAKFLRPKTLFSPKFEDYLNQSPAASGAKPSKPSDNPAKSFNLDDIL
jgi:uncharacterized phage protein (TIGR02220 family)